MAIFMYKLARFQIKNIIASRKKMLSKFDWIIQVGLNIILPLLEKVGSYQKVYSFYLDLQLKTDAR